jgi:glycosyltransferase involved in cell wall biosynthesis
VLLQGYPHLEYFVIDGGSTDNSIEVLQKYEPWINCWVSEPDSGQAHALNKGICRSKGQLVGYLNSDDIYNPGILERVANDYIQTGETKNYWAAYPVEDIGECSPVVHLSRIDVSPVWWITGSASLHQPGVFWNRALFDEVGGFDEKFHYAFDRKFFMELIFRSYRPALFSGGPAAKFRVHPKSKTYLENEKQNADNRFLQEMNEISNLYKLRLNKLQSRILENIERQKYMSKRYEILQCKTVIRRDVFEAYAAILAKYPSSVFVRFFWGTLRQMLSRG